jgi:hypothetical protein
MFHVRLSLSLCTYFVLECPSGCLWSVPLHGVLRQMFLNPFLWFRFDLFFSPLMPHDEAVIVEDVWTPPPSPFQSHRVCASFCSSAPTLSSLFWFFYFICFFVFFACCVTKNTNASINIFSVTIPLKDLRPPCAAGKGVCACVLLNVHTWCVYTIYWCVCI